MKWLRIAVIGIWCSIPIIAVAIWARTQNEINAIMMELKRERESYGEDIQSISPGSTICYTTDGSTPTVNEAGTCTHGKTYP